MTRQKLASLAEPSPGLRSSRRLVLIMGLDVPPPWGGNGAKPDGSPAPVLPGVSSHLREIADRLALGAQEEPFEGLLFAPEPTGQFPPDAPQGAGKSGAISGITLHGIACPILTFPGSLSAGQAAYPFLHQRLEIDRMVRARQVDAYRDGASPVSLHAFTPGLLGATLRRTAIERSLPFAATHHAGIVELIEQQLVQTLNSWREQTHLSAKDGFGANGPWRELFSFLDPQDDLMDRAWNTLDLLRTARRTLTARHGWLGLAWGKSLLWMARALSGYARDRITGAVAVRDAVREIEAVVRDLGLGSSNSLPDTTEQLVRQAARLVARAYLRWFYRPCALVMVHGDHRAHAELRDAIGVEPARIYHGPPSGTCDAVHAFRAMHDEAVDRTARAVRQPRVVPLHEHRFGPPPRNAPALAGFAAISDIHLGDGDPVERALAMAKLFDCLRIQQFDTLFYVGDVGELSATRKRYENHQLIFNRVRHDRRVTDAVTLLLLTTDTRIPGLAPAGKRRESIVEQLRKDALRRGLVPTLNGELIDVLPGIDDSRVAAGENSRSPSPVREIAICGNHDEGLDLREVLPGCTVAPSLVHYDERSGAVLHHGHALGLPGFRRVLEQSRDTPQLCAALSRERLGSELEAAAVVHDAATACWRLSEGMIDLRRIWKDTLQPATSRTVKSLRSVQSSSHGDGDNPRRRFWESLLSPADDLHLAAQLAAAAHSRETPCWVEVGGHSHIASIEKVTVAHPRTGSMATRLVVNCGKFHGAPLNCVLAKFPEVVVAQWSTKDQQWRISMRARLTEQEVRELLESESAPVSPPGLPGRHPGLPACGAAADTLGTLEGDVLCEVPTEGDGHITRIQALYPHYARTGQVRVLVSGDRGDRPAILGEIPIDARGTGYAIHYDEQGAVRRWSTAWNVYQRHGAVQREAQELAAAIPRFQWIVSDYGPTVTRAHQIARAEARKRGAPLPPLFQVSHQAALDSRWRCVVPGPDANAIRRLDQHLGQRAIDQLRGDQTIGFHYESYHPDILPPLIRPDLLTQQARLDGGFVLVSLRGDVESLAEPLRRVRLPLEWKLYTDRVRVATKLDDRVFAFPKSRLGFCEDILHCAGILADCGFGISSEALHLGIPFVGRPVPHHFEQLCNAAALQRISDVGVVYDLWDDPAVAVLEEVFRAGLEARSPLQRIGLRGPVGPFPDVARQVIDRMLATPAPTR